MTILDLIDKYGPAVAISVIVILGAGQILKQQIIPAFLKLMIEREEFQRKIEIDRLASAQKTDSNIDALAAAMVQMTTQITTILANQTSIRELQMSTLKSLNDGISAMRENVARREGYAKGKAEHKQGDTGPLKAEP